MGFHQSLPPVNHFKNLCCEHKMAIKQLTPIKGFVVVVFYLKMWLNLKRILLLLLPNPNRIPFKYLSSSIRVLKV